MYKTISSILFCAITICSWSQQLQWAKHFAGNGTSNAFRLFPGNNYSSDIAIDHLNNIFIVGNANDSVDFDPSEKEFYISNGKDDIYITKLDHTGGHVWTHLFASDGGNEVTGVEVDTEGNVYISGYGLNEIDFDPSPNQSVIAIQPGDLGFYFLAKYDTYGNFIWVKGSSTKRIVFNRKMAIDASNNLYIAGNFSENFDFNPSSDTDVHFANHNAVFISKFTFNGDYLWTKTIIGDDDISDIMDLIIDNSDNVLIAGLFGCTIDFDPNENVTINRTAYTPFDRFIVKLSKEGMFKWVQTINVNADGAIFASRDFKIAIDDEGSVYATGNFKGYMNINPGVGFDILSSGNHYSTFFIKYTSSGQYLWARAIRGSCNGSGIAIDCMKNIYITGSVLSADFDPTFIVKRVQSEKQSASMNFLAEYDTLGILQWVGLLGNNGYGSGPKLSGVKIKNDIQYVFGRFKQLGDFELDGNTFELKQTGIGTNTFIAKYKDIHSPDTKKVSLNCDEQKELEPELLGDAYYWSDGSTNPTTWIQEAGTYWVEIKTENCVFTEEFIVEKESCSSVLEMPNVFSPNADGVNDFFKPVTSIEVDFVQFQVYNRWGRLVYQTDTAPYWNGFHNNKECSQGVYFWTASFINDLGKEESANGSLTLVR